MKFNNPRSGSPPHNIVIPGPGQESVWHYPRPPQVQNVSRRIRVLFDGGTLADTTNALRVIETASTPVYYIPPEHVNMDLLEKGAHTTLCEWKGQAQYWHVRTENRSARNAAWSYPHPYQGFGRIRDFLAFYASKMDICYVDDDPVTPQPGPFYGGWITPDITGPFKGEPGSSAW